MKIVDHPHGIWTDDPCSPCPGKVPDFILQGLSFFSNVSQPLGDHHQSLNAFLHTGIDRSENLVSVQGYDGEVDWLPDFIDGWIATNAQNLLGVGIDRIDFARVPVELKTFEYVKGPRAGSPGHSEDGYGLGLEE